MDMIDRSKVASNKDADLSESMGALSRRAVLKSATIAAGAVAGVSSVLADNSPAADFGAPLVEVHVPAGALTLEQKDAMIRGVTDVLVGAIKMRPEQRRRIWVQIFETAEGGWGVGGRVFVPRKQ